VTLQGLLIFLNDIVVINDIIVMRSLMRTPERARDLLLNSYQDSEYARQYQDRDERLVDHGAPF